MDAEPLYYPLHGYRPLRLIRLLPGGVDDMLSIQLFAADIAFCTDASIIDSYEALSYTWGASAVTKNILCNGRQFALRENAFSLLHRLRKAQSSRTLWMDCICINQDDIAERSAQVRFMHEIYANAMRCVVWLGSENDDSDLAMTFISNLDAETLMAEWVFTKVDTVQKTFLLDDMASTAENKRIVKALCSLLLRAWVRRIWVQQEAAMNPNTVVMCGDKQVPWNNFSALAWGLDKRTSLGWPEEFRFYDQLDVDAAITAIKMIQLNRHKLEGEHPSDYVNPQRPFKTYTNVVPSEDVGHVPSVTKLLSDCASCEATDPRDKIYAVMNLVGMYGDAQGRMPKIDYQRPWQIVYMDAARYLYEIGEVRVINDAGRSRQQNFTDLPSWVPDWRHAPDVDFITHEEVGAGGCAWQPHVNFHQPPRKEAARNSLPQYTHIDTNDRRRRTANIVLKLDCIMMDKIVYVSSTCRSGSPLVYYDDVFELKEVIERSLSYVKEHVPRYATGETGERAMAAAMVANTTHEDAWAIPDYYQVFDEFQDWLHNGLNGQAPTYVRALENSGMFQESSFCVTAHGLMCQVPKMASVGDYVGILSGFYRPVALHRISHQDQGYFELLGCCYIHGMMQGRAWDLIMESKCKYHDGSEDQDPAVDCTLGDGIKDADEDFHKVLPILGKRKIGLV